MQLRCSFVVAPLCSKDYVKSLLDGQELRRASWPRGRNCHSIAASHGQRWTCPGVSSIRCSWCERDLRKGHDGGISSRHHSSHRKQHQKPLELGPMPLYPRIKHRVIVSVAAGAGAHVTALGTVGAVAPLCGGGGVDVAEGPRVTSGRQVDHVHGCGKARVRRLSCFAAHRSVMSR